MTTKNNNNIIYNKNELNDSYLNFFFQIYGDLIKYNLTKSCATIVTQLFLIFDQQPNGTKKYNQILDNEQSKKLF